MQITLRHVERSDALESRIRRSVRKLERLYGGILGSRIVVEAPHNRQQQGRQFSVRVEVKVPGNDIVVNREHHEDPYVALRDAFSAAGRQVEDYARRQRREIRARRAAIAEGAPDE
jgi:ribosomal subunit interface protein